MNSNLQSRMSAYHWWICVLVVAISILLLLSLLLNFRFGNLDRAYAFFTGRIIEARISNIADEASDSSRTFRIHLKNNSLEPITILGATSNCDCLQVSKLPLLVPALSSNVQVVATVKSLTEGKDFRIIFTTDYDEAPSLIVNIGNAFNDQESISPKLLKELL